MTESHETYLKAIYLLQKKTYPLHQVEIAEEMGLSRASVCSAMKKLEAQGFIRYGPEAAPILTRKGLRIARELCERHDTLTAALINLGVNREQAVRDACRLEHIISDRSYQAIKAQVAASETS